MEETKSSCCQCINRTTAICGGGLAAIVLMGSGPLTELHEQCHALAMRLLTTCKPVVEVEAWDAWKKAFFMPGLGGKLRAGVSALFGFESSGGITYAGPGTLNSLGKMIGGDATDVIISFAGPASALPIYAGAAIGGVCLRDEHPNWGAALIAFGIVGHLFESLYPTSAAFMSASELVEEAFDGHDFASIAVDLGQMGDLSPVKVARGVAVGWTASVPTVVVCVWLVKPKRSRDSKESIV